MRETLNQNLRRCRYCGEKVTISDRAGRNVIGEMGYISVCTCVYCGSSVLAWSRKNQEEAREKAISYWNRGIYDAKVQ